MPKPPTNSTAIAGSSPVPCSGALGVLIMDRAGQLQRELTPLEMVPIIAGFSLQHRNWHNLSGSDQLLVAKLEQCGYLESSSQGFVGRVRLPNKQLTDK